MNAFFTVILSFLLFLVSCFLILFTLMQRPSEGGGFGNSLGGNVMESAFGGDAGNVLTRATIRLVIGFFLLAFILSLISIHRSERASHRLRNRVVGGSEEVMRKEEDGGGDGEFLADEYFQQSEIFSEEAK
ncbi:MAG: preprotein translocase subunit SecG [Puniceicoccales bacterium]|jgi:protein translocase SecG subunit|nr:preprotein translocase subunit SecG [Puniceicoccales bacterium]